MEDYPSPAEFSTKLTGKRKKNKVQNFKKDLEND